MSKTENDISEFDGFMEDYIASQELFKVPLRWEIVLSFYCIFRKYISR
jgi:hypothetical protein